MTRILVTGPKGMLGKAVVEAAELAGHTVFGEVQFGSPMDVCDPEQMAVMAEAFAPDVVINCAGVIPLKKAPASCMVAVNALAPHLLAEHFPSAFIVQVSTDCVFSGIGSFPHEVSERPDPLDLYGKSKLAGELHQTRARSVTVRTSFIGPKHGLLPWLLAHMDGDVVSGYINATWSGSTHKEVARHLVRIAEERLPGLVHLSAPHTTKYQLLHDLVVMLKLPLSVVPVAMPKINRALEGTQFMDPVSVCVEDLR